MKHAPHAPASWRLKQAAGCVKPQNACFGGCPEIEDSPNRRFLFNQSHHPCEIGCAHKICEKAASPSLLLMMIFPDGFDAHTFMRMNFRPFSLSIIWMELPGCAGLEENRLMIRMVWHRGGLL